MQKLRLQSRGWYVAEGKPMQGAARHARDVGGHVHVIPQSAAEELRDCAEIGGGPLVCERHVGVETCGEATGNCRAPDINSKLWRPIRRDVTLRCVGAQNGRPIAKRDKGAVCPTARS